MASPSKKLKAADKVLVFGSTGWIGGRVISLLKDQGVEVIAAKSRLENREDVAKELDAVKPTRILNAAGLTGRPNVDWCESNKEETIRVNVIGTLNLADLAFLRGIHVTVYATGCIYEYDEAHKIKGKGFKEEDAPNFSASFYSRTKAMLDNLLSVYSNVLVLRLRMPLSSEYEHPRSFITKITHYARVVDVPNSMTNLDEMLPISLDMSKNQVIGVFNFTNPGAVSHNEILQMYKDYIHPSFTWQNFSLEEQAKVIKAGRSNNELDTTKLQKLYPTLKDIHSSLHSLFAEMKKKMPANAPVPTKWT